MSLQFEAVHGNKTLPWRYVVAFKLQPSWFNDTAGSGITSEWTLQTESKDKILWSSPVRKKKLCHPRDKRNDTFSLYLSKLIYFLKRYSRYYSIVCVKISIDEDLLDVIKVCFKMYGGDCTKTINGGFYGEWSCNQHFLERISYFLGIVLLALCSCCWQSVSGKLLYWKYWFYIYTGRKFP